MTDILPFYYEDRKVRVIKDESGAPWWVAKDVCHILEHSNHKVAIQMLEDDERGVRKVYPPERPDGVDINVVSESGLYNLIFRSNKPEARKFRRWVTHEVLPAIRKHGFYAMPGHKRVLSEFNISGLKPNQRLQAMEIASRMFQLDDAGREELFSCYGMICESIRAEAPETSEIPDHVRRFVAEKCDTGPESRAYKDDLYAAYIDFAESIGKPPLSRARFFKALYLAAPVRPRVVRVRERNARRWVVAGVGLSI